VNNLTVINHNGTFAVDSREVALMVEKPHNDLLKSIRQYCEYLAQGNFSLSDFFIESTYQDSTGRTLPCYLLTRKGCDMVANKMTGEKGVIFTAMYVTKFEEMEKALKGTPQVPQTFAEALRLAADLAEANDQLQQQNALMAPKAEFFDAVADSKDAIAIGEAAKVLDMGIGRNKLFEFLRKKKVLMRDNLPYQEFIDRGYFRTVEQKYQTSEGETKISIKTLVYQKGLDYIRRLLQDSGKLAIR
jgi:anti-repressor protein